MPLPPSRRTFLGAAAAFGLVGGVGPMAENDETPGGQRFDLGNGRRLGVEIFGDPAGWPILYFHGIPTSRIEARWYEAAAKAHRCCLVAIDRPGFGLSDFQPGRQVVDWADDVAAFVNAREVLEAWNLNLSQFSILSFSSGSAYALAAARRLSERRLRSIAIVDGVGPLDQIGGASGMAKVGFNLAKRRPMIATAAFERAAQQIRCRPEPVLRRFSRFYACQDARIFREPSTARLLVQSFLECVRCGPRGVVHDMALLAQPWGFCVNDVKHLVRLWYGRHDATTPVGSVGCYLNRMLPQSTLTVNPNEGHLSMLDTMADAVIQQLVKDRDASKLQP